MNQEVAFHLYTMGTDCVTISSCEGSKQSTLYSQYISQDILNSALSVEILTGNREVDLKPARVSGYSYVDSCITICQILPFI